MTCCGFPIGTQQYVDSFVDQRISIVNGRVDLLASLNDEPQMALKMLIESGNVGVDYMSQVVPHPLLCERLRQFDNRIFDFMTKDILSVDLDSMDILRIHRAKLVAQLPQANGGLGLISSEFKAFVLYLCTLMKSVGDPLFDKFKGALQQDVADTYYALCEKFGVARIDPSHPLSAVLPSEPEYITDISFAPQAVASFTNIGLQRCIMQYGHSLSIQRITRKLLRLDKSIPDNRSDLVHFMTMMFSSQLTRILAVDLAKPINRIRPADFRHTVGFMIGLPVATAYGQRMVQMPGHGYPVAMCMKHQVPLDVNGNHVSACCLCAYPRDRVHSAVNQVCAYFGKVAGYAAHMSPSLETMLGTHLHDEVSLIFPKHTNKQVRDNQRKVTDAISAMVSAQDRVQAVREVLSTLPRMEPTEAGAIRPDVLLFPLNGKGKQLILDGKVTHGTCTTQIDAQEKFFSAKAVQVVTLFADGLAPSEQDGDSPAVAKAVREKREKYGLVADLINLEVAAKLANTQAEVIPAVITHRGEMSGAILDLIEHLTSRFRSVARHSFDIDGRTVVQRVSDFRRDFKTSLMVQLASRWGSMLAWGFARGVSCVVQ
jgi:hypothetical protein